MRMAIIALLAASPALAQDQQAAPQYFVDAAFQTSTAQVLAVNCSVLSIDLGAMARTTDATLAQLAEDGFTPENMEARMADPTDTIAAMQSSFLEKHGLANGAPETAVCAAGQREIAEDTPIGALLLEVEG